MMKMTIAENCSVQAYVDTVGLDANAVYTPVEGPYLGRQVYPSFRSFDPVEYRKWYMTDNGRRLSRNDMGETLCLIEHESEYDEVDEIEDNESKHFEMMELAMIERRPRPASWISRHGRRQYGLDSTITLHQLMLSAR